MRERQWVQRWSDTEDLVIRTPSQIEYWRTRERIGGRLIPAVPITKEDKDDMDKFKSTLGGVPFLKSEKAEFADLARHMADCPYNALIINTEEAA
jgi:hypothetical protein